MKPNAAVNGLSLYVLYLESQFLEAKQKTYLQITLLFTTALCISHKR